MALLQSSLPSSLFPLEEFLPLLDDLTFDDTGRGWFSGSAEVLVIRIGVTRVPVSGVGIAAVPVAEIGVTTVPAIRVGVVAVPVAGVGVTAVLVSAIPVTLLSDPETSSSSQGY